MAISTVDKSANPDVANLDRSNPVVGEAPITPEVEGDAAPHCDHQELEEGIAHLKELVEYQGIDKARLFVTDLEARWPEDDRVRYWARVLAPPRVIGHGPSRPSAKAEHDWLKSHRHEYPGCWIAVKGDRFVAADPDFDVVWAAMRQNPDFEDALMHLQPPYRFIK